jgi:hypothetical protein
MNKNATLINKIAQYIEKLANPRGGTYIPNRPQYSRIGDDERRVMDDMKLRQQYFNEIVQPSDPRRTPEYARHEQQSHDAANRAAWGDFAHNQTLDTLGLAIPLMGANAKTTLGRWAPTVAGEGVMWASPKTAKPPLGVDLANMAAPLARMGLTKVPYAGQALTAGLYGLDTYYNLQNKNQVYDQNYKQNLGNWSGGPTHYYPQPSAPSNSLNQPTRPTYRPSPNTRAPQPTPPPTPAPAPQPAPQPKPIPSLNPDLSQNNSNSNNNNVVAQNKPIEANTKQASYNLAAKLISFLKTAESSPAWQRSEGKNPEGGLNAKGRASYKRETGGTLKAPVTESNPKGERAKRQNSFCSRMCGMKRVNTGSEAKSNPDSRINKSLRKWNCKCGEVHNSLLEKIACRLY